MSKGLRGCELADDSASSWFGRPDVRSDTSNSRYYYNKVNDADRPNN